MRLVRLDTLSACCASSSGNKWPTCGEGAQGSKGVRKLSLADRQHRHEALRNVLSPLAGAVFPHTHIRLKNLIPI